MGDKKEETKKKTEESQEKKVCGLVMPISEIDGCSANHWADVKGILCDAAEMAGFKASLVSDAEEIRIIQKNIIQNLYHNPIVICDVSAKNPNVMFELGMRLAFDKPTIIVKDDKTSYSFDTGSIKHIEYPRDLRYGDILDFKEELAKAIEATYEASQKPDYSTFLKEYGTFIPATLETQEIPREDFIIKQLSDLKEIIHMNNTIKTSNPILIREKLIKKIANQIHVDTDNQKDNKHLEQLVKDFKLKYNLNIAEIDLLKEELTYLFLF